MRLTEAAAKALADICIAEAEEMGANDLRTWLSDAVRDCGEGEWCYLQDFIGDSESGDVIYCCGGDMKRAPYEIRSVNGKMTATIDTENAIDVLPRTVWEPEADEADHYASMESRKLYAKSYAQLCERFIGKAERDSADAGSFAGKGKSFPILSPADVKAAVRSMGRAGSGNYDTGTLKRNIKRIAKAKGFGKHLPKAWQDEEGDNKESAAREGAGDLRLVESAVHFLDPIQVSEARSDYEVKLIAPGKGSSAYYPAPVLERDGPKVFSAGTHMYWNHATDSEVAQRPEGDLNNLAAVLTSNAYWKESGREGPGLYARAKVFSDFAERVAEKAPHTGLSIRGGGNVVREKGKPKLVEGLPELAELTCADSVDFVTRAGAGGMVLCEAARADEFCEKCGVRKAGDCQRCAEAARAANANQEEPMAVDNQELRETRAEVRKLRERLALQDASGAIAEYFSTVRVAEGVQKRVSGRVLGMNIPLTEAGDLDRSKLKELVERETNEELTYLSGLSGGRLVTGMGSTAVQPQQPSKKDVKEARKAEKKALKESASIYGFGGGDHKIGRRILNEGRGAFDPYYNAREHGAIAQAGPSLPGAEA